MADTQILLSATHAAPAEYVVPNSVEFLLKAVRADFTDNGAASDWLPALKVISDAGHIVSNAVDQAVKVTAGDDAEVSWFRGVKHASGGTPAASPIPWAASFGTVTLSAAANTSVTGTQARVATNDATVFDLAFGELNVKTQGLYLVIGRVSGTSAAIAQAQEYQLSVDFDTFSLQWSKLEIGGMTVNTGRRTTIAGTFEWRLDHIQLFNCKAASVPAGFITDTNTIQAPGATMACGSNIGAVRLSDAIAGSIA